MTAPHTPADCAGALAEAAVALNDSLVDDGYDVREVLSAVRAALTTLGQVVGTLAAPLHDLDPDAATVLRQADEPFAAVLSLVDQATVATSPH